MKQIHRVNYANQKHHREQLREQIDPRVIQTIEVDTNPSLNYKNAFKAVYYDELEKTIRFQEEKLLKDKQNLQTLPITQQNESMIYRNPSSPALKYSYAPLQTLAKNGQYLQIRDQSRSTFKDYEEERHKKFDHFIEGGYDGGQSFFRAQDQYQKRKQQQSKLMKYGLMEQLQLKENRRLQDYQARSEEVEAFKENRKKQMEYEVMQAERQKYQQLKVGEQVKHQAQDERLRKHHKSYFEVNKIGRHNPITNPIEYHIDNPYILQKYSVKSYQQYEPQQSGQAGKKQQQYHYPHE